MVRRETLYCSSRIHGAIFPPLFHHLLRLVPRVYSYISALMDRRHFRVNFRIPSLNEYLIYFLRVCNSWQVQLVDFPNISFVIINFQIWVSVLFQPERKRDEYILSKLELSNSTSFITFFFFVSRCTQSLIVPKNGDRIIKKIISLLFIISRFPEGNWRRRRVKFFFLQVLPF